MLFAKKIIVCLLCLAYFKALKSVTDWQRLVCGKNIYNLRLCTHISSSYEPVLSTHCLATLDLGTGVEQPFDCLIIQNCQAM